VLPSEELLGGRRLRVELLEQLLAEGLDGGLVDGRHRCRTVLDRAVRFQIPAGAGRPSERQRARRRWVRGAAPRRAQFVRARTTAARAWASSEATRSQASAAASQSPSRSRMRATGTQA